MRTLLLVTGNPEMDRTDLSKADRLRAGELEKRLDVAIIRRSDRFQISRACSAFFDEIGRTQVNEERPSFVMSTSAIRRACLPWPFEKGGMKTSRWWNRRAILSGACVLLSIQ